MNLAGKNNDKGLSITVIIILVLIILTWPRLQLGVKFGYEENVIPTHSNQAMVETWVSNRGGIIGNSYIITPESCISVNISDNINCTHIAKSGVLDCSSGICSKTSALDSPGSHNIYLKFPKTKPDSFTFSLHSRSSVSFVPIKSFDRIFRCELQEPIGYNCTELL